MAAAKTRSAASCHGIDLIDEDDAGGVLLGLLEHVSHTGCADTDEHLDKVRAADRIERHPGLTCHGLCKKRLAGSGRALEQHALRNAGADLGVVGGILQEIDDLREVLLLLVKSCHIGEGNPVLRIRAHGTALSEVHHPRIRSAARRRLHVDEVEQERDHHADKDQREDVVCKRPLIGHVLDGRVELCIPCKILHLRDIGGIQCHRRPVVQGDPRIAGRRLCVGDDVHARHVFIVDVLFEVVHRVGGRILRRAASDKLHRKDQGKQQDQQRGQPPPAASVIVCILVQCYLSSSKCRIPM